MDVGEVRIADDRDFERLRNLADIHDGWKLEYSKRQTSVWTKSADHTAFQMIKLKCIYKDISHSVVFDVLMDPHYRKKWDVHMLESYDIGCLNPNNDIGYYAVRCPSPLKNRDFVLQRSWLDIGKEIYLINHSVYHETLQPKKGFIRAVSFMTGFVLRPHNNGGCDLSYVTHCDPKGDLPPWIVNKLTQIFAPKMVRKIHKACLKYTAWKKNHHPNLKPWLHPEQMTLDRIDLNRCVKEDLGKSTESLEHIGIEEGNTNNEGFFNVDDG